MLDFGPLTPAEQLLIFGPSAITITWLAGFRGFKGMPNVRGGRAEIKPPPRVQPEL